ncbi:MAG: phage integrase SAM-like domain-containing protein [Ignavibacteria bacterium]|nr:phage integrase SAM-like domain-containing protein [Ignavibacteria bacterium]
MGFKKFKLLNQKALLHNITFKNYCDPSLPHSDKHESFIEGFKDYLINKSGVHNNTASGYFETFREGIKKAFKDGILRENIGRNVSGIKKQESKREYLTFEELQNLASTECDNEKFKRAFLFACLTGLRWSDVSNLK